MLLKLQTKLQSMPNHLRFDNKNFERICSLLAEQDSDLASVLSSYGYPPLWTRPNSFETLVLTILEQQVSLASAYAAYKKLKERIRIVTPSRLLELTDEELKACYFSRQKIVYARELAKAIIMNTISLRKMYHLPEDDVRTELKKLKGIGDWTVDIYLIHALRRTDILPIGDLALVNAFRVVKEMPGASREEISAIASSWKPYRSIATMILWHFYIKKKNIEVVG
jgi:DNA-3-methyladenine glycosylase II